MKIFSPVVAEGSSISNLVIPSGTTYPVNPDEGELFFKTDGVSLANSILSVYKNNAWKSVIFDSQIEQPNFTGVLNSTSQAVLASIPAEAGTQIKCFCSIVNSTSAHSTNLVIVYVNSTVYISEYGTLITGVSLGTFDANISNSNLQVLFTPTNSSSTSYKVSVVVH